MVGHQHFSFEKIVNEESREREFSRSNSAVSFQLASVRAGPDCVPVSLVVYIDGSFIKHGIPVKSIYGTLCCNILVICLSYISHMLVICLSYVCHISVILMS